MSGGHHLVGDELAWLGAAEMAIEAERGAGLGTFQGDHPARNIRGMAGADRVMAGQPGPRTTMTGFAADTV